MINLEAILILCRAYTACQLLACAALVALGLVMVFG